MPQKKTKKGESAHHISHQPELVVKLPSRGAHLVIMGIQKMKASKKNIKYLKNIIKAIQFEIWRMSAELEK